uniref:Uncharacterized protein n=1 Tax=Anguilla anguilla TaxID=7936 RepID=A0A0E9UGX0_ANGAN
MPNIIKNENTRISIPLTTRLLYVYVCVCVCVHWS